MDSGTSAGARSGGGVEISSVPAFRPRVITASLAVILCICLAIAPIAGADFGIEILTMLALAAVVSLLAGVTLELPACIAWAAALLGLEYLLSLGFSAASLDARAPVVGAALLLMAESGFWSLELRAPLRDEGAVHLARARELAVVVLAGTAMAVVPVIAATVEPFAGLLATILGSAAAVGIIGSVVSLVWRPGNDRQRPAQPWR
jgi:hypothetical protein